MAKKEAARRLIRPKTPQDYLARLPQFEPGDAPDFVEVGEAGIAVDDAMRHQRRVQLVG
jgi:hypothetical protein